MYTWVHERSVAPTASDLASGVFAQLVQSPTTATYCVLQLNLRFDGSCFCVYITGCRHRIFCLPLFVLVYGYKAAVWHISVKNIGVQSQCNCDKQDSELATLLATLAISDLYGSLQSLKYMQTEHSLCAHARVRVEYMV